MGSTSCDIQPVAPLSDFPHHRSRRTSTRAGLALALPLLCFARVCVGPHNRLYPTRLPLHAVASAAASPTHRSCGAALVVSHHLGGSRCRLQVYCTLVPIGVRSVSLSLTVQPYRRRRRIAAPVSRSSQRTHPSKVHLHAGSRTASLQPAAFSSFCTDSAPSPQRCTHPRGGVSSRPVARRLCGAVAPLQQVRHALVSGRLPAS